MSIGGELPGWLGSSATVGAARYAGIPGGGCSLARRGRAVTRPVEVRPVAFGGRAWLAPARRSTHATTLLAPTAFALPGEEGFFDFRCFACGIPKNAVNMQGGLFLSELAISVINLILSKSLKKGMLTHLCIINETAYICLFSFPSDSPRVK